MNKFSITLIPLLFLSYSCGTYDTLIGGASTKPVSDMGDNSDQDRFSKIGQGDDETGLFTTKIRTNSFESKLADVVVLVDSSGSMKEELDQVTQNLNRFMSKIDLIADSKVVLIAKSSLVEVQNRVSTDRKLFLDVAIDSHDAPSVLLNLLDPSKVLSSADEAQRQQFRSFLRPNAHLIVLYVTDDDAHENECERESGRINQCHFDDVQTGALSYAERFAQMISQKSLALMQKPIQMNAVIGHKNLKVSGILSCEGTANTGHVYLNLSRNSFGRVWSLCLPDWSKIFDGLATNIKAAVQQGYLLPDDFLSILEVKIADTKVVADQYLIEDGVLYFRDLSSPLLQPGAEIKVFYQKN